MRIPFLVGTDGEAFKAMEDWVAVILQLQRPRLNDGLSASTRKMSPALKAKLLAELRGGPMLADPREAASFPRLLRHPRFRSAAA